MTEIPRAGSGENADTLAGFLLALCAYLLWALVAPYLKLVDHLPVLEVVAHRTLWSLPIAGVVLLALRRTADVRAALRSPRTLLMALLTASLIGFNWAIYVWAIVTERAIEASLGYFINPMVNILLGAALLGERVNRPQMVAIAVAALGVTILAAWTGSIPWASLILAVSFGVYAYFRKTLPIGPSQGFFLEMLILSVPALVYIGWLTARGEGHFGAPGHWGDTALLMTAGLITAVPLILFTFSTKLLRLTTLGLMQYISPTFVFLFAVFIFREPFDLVRGIAFALIWTALAIYSWAAFRAPSEPAPPAAAA